MKAQSSLKSKKAPQSFGCGANLSSNMMLCKEFFIPLLLSYSPNTAL
jgi:hypothetical protein